MLSVTFFTFKTSFVINDLIDAGDMNEGVFSEQFHLYRYKTDSKYPKSCEFNNSHDKPLQSHRPLPYKGMFRVD